MRFLFFIFDEKPCISRKPLNYFLLIYILYKTKKLGFHF